MDDNQKSDYYQTASLQYVRHMYISILYEHFIQQHLNKLIFLYGSCILTDFDVQGWASPSMPLEIDKRNKFIIYLFRYLIEIKYYPFGSI